MEHDLVNQSHGHVPQSQLMDLQGSQLKDELVATDLIPQFTRATKDCRLASMMGKTLKSLGTNKRPTT